MRKREEAPDPRLAALAAAGAAFAAITVCDTAGIVRIKCVPLGKLPSAAVKGVGASTVLDVFTGVDGIAPSGGYESPVGDMRLIADLAAIRHGGGPWAWVPADQVDQEGAPWPLDQRGFLKRMVARAAAAGLSLRSAFEIEWIAGRDIETTINAGPAYGANAIADSMPYVTEVAGALSAHGLEVEQFHPEYSPGQLEISFAPRDPVTAADENVLARWVIRSTSSAAGVAVSFAPVVRADLLGNGCHLHFSLWRDGLNLMGCDGADPLGIAPEARAFLAGIFSELPALVALGCASPLSFRRIGPSRWTGAFTCWGVENREAPLRFIRGSAAGRPGAANAELKCVDASGNPYLFTGAVIAAGLAGIARKAELPPAVPVDPATLSADERAAARAHSLPGSLEAAAAALEASAVLKEAMGADLHGVVVAVRRAEAAAAGAMASDEERLARYRWRY
jgi:glutamine synthetase